MHESFVHQQILLHYNITSHGLENNEEHEETSTKRFHEEIAP